MSERFRKVNSEDGTKIRFRVFLIHGHSDDWERVKNYIEADLKFEVVVSVEKFTGETLLQKIRKQIWHDCDCAVAILSADDQQQNLTHMARPNVIFELGYCMGFFDLRYWGDDEIEPVILIVEDRTSLPSDLEGIERIKYSNVLGQGISESFETLRSALNAIYSQVNDYFK